MKTLLAALAIALTTGSATLAFDADTQTALDRLKTGKVVKIVDMAQFMRASAKWCYVNETYSCAWTEIYLDVTDQGATFEIANAWDADTDIAFTDKGIFKDNRYICESGEDWIPTVRATRRSDGSSLDGRLLWELKSDIYDVQSSETLDCFDYVFLSSDADHQVVTLRQRQYTDDVPVPENDVEVTIHFNTEDAAGLTWRW